MSSHVFTRRFTRRATSVPVEPIRVIDTNGASTARRISNAAIDDTEAILAASKRHDRQLIDDISAKMANQSLPAVGIVKRTARTTIHRPPLPPAPTRSVTTVSGLNWTTLPSRRYTSRDLNDHGDDDDVMAAMPATPITKSVMRASSVPPPNRRLQHQPQLLLQQQVPAATSTQVTSYYRPTTFDGFWTSLTSPNWTNYYLADYEKGDEVKLGYVPTRVTCPPGQVSPVADLAIKQAHRNLDRIERELTHVPSSGSTNSSNRYYQTQPAVNEYRTPPTTGARVTWNPVVSSVRYRRASLSPVASYHQRRASSPVRPSELISFASSSAAVPSYGAGFERKVATNPRKRPDFNEPRNYRSQSQQPISPLFIIAGSGSDDKNKVSARRYIDSVSNAFNNPPEKPKMSDARRKVRDVLCKVKNDPHYFD